MGKQQDTTLDQHVSGQANGNGLSKPAHALTFSQVTEDIKANAENGLSTAEAKERHSKYGTNELGDAGGVEPGKILIRQIANAMTLVCGTRYWCDNLVSLTSDNRYSSWL